MRFTHLNSITDHVHLLMTVALPQGVVLVSKFPRSPRVSVGHVSAPPHNQQDSKDFLPMPWCQKPKDYPQKSCVRALTGHSQVQSKEAPYSGTGLPLGNRHVPWMLNWIAIWGICRPGRRFELVVTFLRPFLNSLRSVAWHIVMLTEPLPSKSAFLRGRYSVGNGVLVGVACQVASKSGMPGSRVSQQNIALEQNDQSVSSLAVWCI